jgi:hypothetical protein
MRQKEPVTLKRVARPGGRSIRRRNRRLRVRSNHVRGRKWLRSHGEPSVYEDATAHGALQHFIVGFISAETYGGHPWNVVTSVAVDEEHTSTG